MVYISAKQWEWTKQRMAAEEMATAKLLRRMRHVAECANGTRRNDPYNWQERAAALVEGARRLEAAEAELADIRRLRAEFPS